MEQEGKIYLYRRIVQAKHFIDLHFADNIDLSKIADQANFSKFHFIRLFKKMYGRTPHQYLTVVRIEKSRQFLRAGLPVSEVCCEVGFQSVSSFSGLFKQIVGFSPSTYFLQQQEMRVQIDKSPLHYIPGCFADKNGWTKLSNFEEVFT